MTVRLTLLQAAPSTHPTRPIVAPPLQSWSILNLPACPGSSTTEVIVSGGKGTAEQHLPLPGERPPQDCPRQPTGDPRAALYNAGPVCSPGGCTGVDLLTVPVVLIRGVGALAYRFSAIALRVFPREGGDPVWAPAFAGAQGKETGG